MDYSDIRRLISALFNPGACFMLGAGVPEKLIPVTSNFSKYIEIKNQVGIYDPTPNITHQIHEVFFRENADGLKSHITLPTLRLIALLHIDDCRIKAGKSDIIPPEYAIFKYLPISSVIADFNLDGFAEYWCSQRCIYPHGQSKIYETLLNQDAAFDLIDLYQDHSYENIRNLQNTTIFEKENEIYPYSPEYRSLERVLRGSSVVFIIGYSFALWDSKFYDFYTLDLFSSIIQGLRKPVFIINPFAYSLSVALKELCKSNEIFSYDLLWNKFASALLNSIHRKERCIKQISSKEVMADYN